MAEFELIERIRARAASRPDMALGIGDDAALLVPPPGLQLAVAMDTLNAGVHFPAGTAPADIGWKALAVNLSDLAAMGATPAWCTLSLSLPDDDGAFVEGFLDGFLALAALHDVALVGGDTTRGPLSISVAAHGFVEPGLALRRAGAAAGDDVWVSGTLGDAAGALAQWREERRSPGQADLAPADSRLGAIPARDPALRARLDRPAPRVALGRALRGVATACIDVSDGLLADLGHLCAASGVAAGVHIDALPAGAALRAAFDRDTRRTLQATGGDDYELCFTAPAPARPAVEAAAAAAATAVARIGSVVPGHGVHARDAAGAPWHAGRAGYQHFD